MYDEQTQAHGNGFRLVIILISAIVGYATGAWDVVIMLGILCLLMSNWLSDLAIKKLPTVKHNGQVRSRDLPFNDRGSVQNRVILAGSGSSREPAEPRMNALERPEPDGTGTFVLNATLEEIEWLQRMIIHRATAEKPTKASTIFAGNGSKKGGSTKYQRASELYDLLFAEPEREPAGPEMFKDGERVRMDFPVSGRAA